MTAEDVLTALLKLCKKSDIVLDIELLIEILDYVSNDCPLLF